MVIREIRSVNSGKDTERFLKSINCKNSINNLIFPLPNMKQVTEKEYWSCNSSYSFKLDVWAGQIKHNDSWATVKLYFYDIMWRSMGGFAVLYYHNEEKAEYYEWWSCNHKWKEKNIGRCLNRFTCELCSESFEADSSD